MPISLTYEAPRWVEFRRIGKGARAAMIGLGVFAALAALVILLVVLLTHRFHRVPFWKPLLPVLPLSIVPLAIALALTARSAALVYSNRIEIRISALGLAFWKKTWLWADVASYALYKNMRPVPPDGLSPLPIWARRQFKVLGFTIGWTIVMSGGDGVGLKLASGEGLLLGSDDPEKLLAAINESRSLFAPPPSP
ncbi:MAG: hypothetical protein ABSF29_11835 [Tepidisphaeraceae bacterium]